MDRRHHTLAAKAVERPEQHAVELAAAGVLEQGGKLFPLARALAPAHAINVLADEVVAGIGTPGAQIAELVLWILAFVLSRYSGIDRNAHDHLPWISGTVSSARPKQTEFLVGYQWP